MNGRILKRFVNPEGAKQESKSSKTKYKTRDKVIEILFMIIDDNQFTYFKKGMRNTGFLSCYSLASP